MSRDIDILEGIALENYNSLIVEKNIGDDTQKVSNRINSYLQRLVLIFLNDPSDGTQTYAKGMIYLFTCKSFLS